MKTVLLVVLLLVTTFAFAQEHDLRQSPDAKMAPRSLLLTGGDLDSTSGRYMITFPYPNECLTLGPIKATSRPMALYRAVSNGGFTLKPSAAGLTVWTIEEWNDLKKESWYPQFAKANAKHCHPAKETK